METLKQLRPYLSILKDNPLLIGAIFIASIMTTIFTSVQPMFIKIFLNGLTSNESIKFLVSILLFILAGLILAYLFDLISVSLRFLIRYNFNLSLYDSFIKSSQGLSDEAFEFAITDGLPRISEAILKVSLDFIFQIITLIFIIGFLCLENIEFGVIILCFFIAGVFSSTYFSNLLARISKFEVRAKEQFIRSMRQNPTGKLKIKFFDFYFHRFELDSIIVIIHFILFQIFPIIFLLYYLKDRFVTIGSITSILIYISMLRKPFLNIVQIIKTVKTSVMITAFIRKDLENYLTLLHKTLDLDRGLILVTEGAKLAGASLDVASNVALKNACLFKRENSAQTKNLNFLIERSKNEKIFLLAPLENIKYGHFVLDLKNNKLNTSLQYLGRHL